MFDTFFGLPLHILVIHAVVVLVPLCAAMAVLMLFSTTWRERLRWPLLVLLTIAVGSAFVAKKSGEALDARLAITTNPDLNRHVLLGGKAPWIVLVFWMLAVAWLVLDSRREWAGSPSPGTLRLLGVVTLVAAVGATSWIVVTGDAGSRAVWSQIVKSTNAR